MPRGLKRRLDRLWAAYQRDKAARDAEREQQTMRERFVATLRRGLVSAGIDPATVPALRRFDEPPQAAPAPRPVAPAPRPLERLYRELARIVARCRDHALDLATATPIELFALYCFDPAAGPWGLALARA